MCPLLFCSQGIYELAIKWIIINLHATKDKGVILWPITNFNLDMFLDPDFAGMWHMEHAKLCNNVLSRTGFVIAFWGCPMSWSSKLQTEITLSTTEGEYITLSTATRELLSLHQLLQDIANNSFISIPQLPPSKKKRPIFIHLKFMRTTVHVLY